MMPLSSDQDLRLVVLVENTVGNSLPLLGEHGYACLVECAAGRILFDTGRGQALLHNLEVLGIPAESIDAVVLSHGHDDHTGGLFSLLKRIGPRPVYAHPGIFSPRWHANGSKKRNIGINSSREELEKAGARFRLLSEFTELAHGIWFSGFIPRMASAEKGDHSLVVTSSDGGGWQSDPLEDDAALVISCRRGLVVLLGCAHAGIINTLEAVRSHFGPEPLHAVVGGTHLGSVEEPQFMATVDYLSRLPDLRIGVSHCTGLPRSAILHAQFPDRVFFATAGTIFEV